MRWLADGKIDILVMCVLCVWYVVQGTCYTCKVCVSVAVSERVYVCELSEMSFSSFRLLSEMLFIIFILWIFSAMCCYC